MEERIKITSGTPWEDKIGYSRAVRIGRIIEVSGTVAIDGEKIIAPGDPYKQTKFIIQKIEKALNDAGGSLTDVIRTRIYVTNIMDWDAVGRAHGESFKTIKPVTTMVEVKSLIDPNFVVEIEATAYLSK
ncbi:MAG: RidA family protein [Ignavibacteriota bacterium]|jgi:enamine deaminase RidA (YjgF/YER057c/UK114 family)|nr:MAG: RidA family protein [Chlorobiota bacterium]MBE7476240.1 RidA family protein [Ignavibacteriales bacterium]MBL1124038.1 RidA family protein [Ignavibacteriota bacterium]MCC7093966.1 RidA family protein [Ignavibacteriaceae bacterium]MCE7856454.1 RidA family protein [Ignavibacteria bacterium CHB3]MEB2297292.1 RidA family protein [Ignavibacteria bacterium]